MISGIAITLGNDDSRDTQAGQALAATQGLTLGDQAGRRVAAVLDVSSPDEAEDIWSRMLAIPGVVSIDCVCVLDLDEPSPSVSTGES